MKPNYFIPTQLYKEYLLLDLIYKNNNITQREMSRESNISLTMVNKYLNDFEINKYIEREYISRKVVKYHITAKGIEHMRVLNIGYLKETQSMYNKAKEDIYLFLNKMINKGYKDIILYGAGEVAEIILQTIIANKDIPLNVVALIDDDVNKQGNSLVNVNIEKIDCINKYRHDSVMISSYTNHSAIMSKLIEFGYNQNRIEYFFK